jgi:maleate cis-trans isomerase
MIEVDPSALQAASERGTYGWKARVGFITVASTIETPLYELYQMSPAGIAYVAAGLGIRKVTAEAVDEAWGSVMSGSVEVAAYHIDHLIVSGAPLAYFRGRGADRDLVKEVESACGIPTTFELTATVDGLRSLHAERIAIATPFGDATNERLRTFFETEGFVVAALVGLGYDANPDITRISLERTYQCAKAAWRADPSVDAIYITCPRWPVSPIIEPLEQDLGVPVVASMQSALWDTLRRLNLGASISGYGKLLRMSTLAAAD